MNERKLRKYKTQGKCVRVLRTKPEAPNEVVEVVERS